MNEQPADLREQLTAALAGAFKPGRDDVDPADAHMYVRRSMNPGHSADCPPTPREAADVAIAVVQPAIAHATKRAEEAEAANDRVRRLCNLTINTSCRVQAIDQARDTLAVLDQSEASTIICSRCNDNPVKPELGLCESCDAEITAINQRAANLDPRREST